MRLADLLTQASSLKVGVVQIADNLALDKLDPGERRDARDQAADLGLRIEIGTRGVEPIHLLQYLDLALSFDARLVRTLIDSLDSSRSLEWTEQSIRKILPQFEANGITLGIENYEAYSCCSLATLVRKLDCNAVGVCLDTVNSLGALETPKQVVETLAPLTVNLHVKDFVIERVPQMMGFVVRGAPAGMGKLDIPWVLSQVPHGNQASVIVEQWPPLGGSVEATVALEQKWAEQSVEYLRACGCS